MKVAIMQPYFFPYIGYFQLMNAVDEFVLYDDVNFIKQGWITKNRILLNNKDFNLILHVQGASSFKKINELELMRENQKLLKTIEQAYKKAPFFNFFFPVLESVFLLDETNLSLFLTFQLQKIAAYLSINTVIKISSEIEKDNSLKGYNKVIEICKKSGASGYINAIGGQDLYDKKIFNENGIELNFIKTMPIRYKQFDNEFIPWLSIIDVCMFNSVDEIKNMLNQFELI